jgi:PilZ domain
MTLTIRPDMKLLLSVVEGSPSHVIGRTIDAPSPTGTFAAMVEVLDDTELRVGARVRSSYVEPAGVHTFDATLIDADPLTLNHRMVRIALTIPNETERVQRREDVRVDVELDAVVELDDETVVRCTTADLSAGGIALAWDPVAPTPEVGDEVRVRFGTDQHTHDLGLLVLGTTTRPQPSRGANTLVRGQFVGVTSAERDRLVAAVFAIQRDTLHRQKRGAGVR